MMYKHTTCTWEKFQKHKATQNHHLLWTLGDVFRTVNKSLT